MNRAMFAMVVSRLDKIDETLYEASSFSDVPSGHWAAACIAWAAENGIVYGRDGGLFEPSADVTRAEMAVMLDRYMKYNGFTLPAAASSVAFNDSAAIRDWASAEVSSLTRAGIFEGRPGNLFEPQAIATRAEVATIFARFVQKLLG